MINLLGINSDSWEKILYSNSLEDIETIQYLHEHEEEILDILLENGMGMSLDEKRKEYIRKILSDHEYKENIDEVIEKIDEIRKSNNYSILQFGKRLPGSSYIVFEFGDKVIKFGKYYKVLNDPNILQPEFQMGFGNNNDYMTVYERLPEVFTQEDKDIAQEMYNRVRSNGILWFDAIGNNVGRTDKRTDESDDGLRIIDAQYMEYERDVLMRIDPERNERYKNGGPVKYNIAIRDYIVEQGYGAKEKEYQEMKEAKRNKSTKEDVGIVAKQSSIKGLQNVKDFFVNLFGRKEKTDRYEK